jgi:hypothetical protein
MHSISHERRERAHRHRPFIAAQSMRLPPEGAEGRHTQHRKGEQAEEAGLGQQIKDEAVCMRVQEVGRDGDGPEKRAPVGERPLPHQRRPQESLPRRNPEISARREKGGRMGGMRHQLVS